MEIAHQENEMNKDQVKGRAQQAEGQVKKTTGKVAGNEELEEKASSKKALAKLNRVLVT